MYQSIPSLTIPRAKPLGNFFDGQIPTPEQKEFKAPTPWSYRKELKPHPQGHFPQLLFRYQPARNRILSQINNFSWSEMDFRISANFSKMKTFMSLIFRGHSFEK